MLEPTTPDRSYGWRQLSSAAGSQRHQSRGKSQRDDRFGCPPAKRQCVAVHARTNAGSIPYKFRREWSLLTAGTCEAECCFRACLQTLGSDLLTATNAFSIGAIFNAQQSPVHGSNLAGDQRGLRFQRSVILHFNRLLG